MNIPLLGPSDATCDQLIDAVPERGEEQQATRTVETRTEEGGRGIRQRHRHSTCQKGANHQKSFEPPPVGEELERGKTQSSQAEPENRPASPEVTIP